MVGNQEDLKKVMELECEKLLNFWCKYAPEKEGKGFYGILNSELEPVKDSRKLLVLFSRLIWTFSSAYRLFRDEQYEILARRAYNYFAENFIDRKYGGAFWELDSDGEVYDGSKHVYGEAFAIYALSEYYRTFGCKSAFEDAIGIYRCVEQYAYDEKFSGYYEILTREWALEEDNQKSNINPHASACKTMNTHLHLLEAYTGLYRVWKDVGLKNKLKQHIKVMVDHIIDKKTWHYKMYFKRNWESVTPEISYGHDIEGSWLLWEAAELLGETDISEYVRPVSLNMAEAVLDEGWHRGGGILYEADPHGIINSARSWWVQAEAVVGFFNAWQMSGEERYMNAVESVWNFIDTEIIDHVNGGWFSYAISDRISRNRIDGWTCPYHNGRMYFEIIERIGV